jgi:hypothetical protein
MVPSGANRTVASVCGPRPFSSTSRVTVTVPSGATVVTFVPALRAMLTTTRLDVVATAGAAGRVLASVGAGAGAADTAGRAGSPPQEAAKQRTERRLFRMSAS